MGLKFLTVSGYRKSWHVSSQCCTQLIESAIGGAEIALCVLISGLERATDCIHLCFIQNQIKL